MTINLIEVIEKNAEKNAKDFSKEEFGYWMDAISDIEDRIDEEPTEQQISNAITELDRFSIPVNKEKNGS